MVQYIQPIPHDPFAAIADSTRRGILDQLTLSDASISDLAHRFNMTLTGMKKHVGLLELAGLVTTQKFGRVRTCSMGPYRLEKEMEWISNYRYLWNARFDALDQLLNELKPGNRLSHNSTKWRTK